MERVRFFNGQLLTAADLEAEQSYHMEKRRLHNRLLHGVGIVSGLDVSIGDGTDAEVVVSPGLALDRRGNEILVGDPVRLDLSVCATGPCYVTIQYAETPTHPVATPNGGMEFGRIEEGFTLGMAAEDPGDSGDADQLSLARVVQQNGQWLVDEGCRRLRTNACGAS